MRIELRVLLGAMLALTVGILCARPYAQFALPYYSSVAGWIAAGHPWQITGLDIAPDDNAPGFVLRLTGAVFKHLGDAQPAGILISKLQVASVIESPVIFWSILIWWPLRSHWERAALLATGIPIFLCLESITTVSQLLTPLAFGSAAIAGKSAVVTPWEYWSRFLESGGRIAMAVVAAVLTVALVRSVGRVAAAVVSLKQACNLRPPYSRVANDELPASVDRTMPPSRRRFDFSAYDPASYDANFSLKPPMLLWLAMLYLARAVLLPFVGGVSSMSGSADVAALTRSGTDTVSMIPAAMALLVLFACARRRPSGSRFTRFIWANGRIILALSAAADLALAILDLYRQSSFIGSSGSLLLILRAIFDIYFPIFIFVSRRVHDVFEDFPARLE
jgi:Protein of unknown function (DUF2919)